MLTVAEVAKRLAVSTQCVYLLCADGLLPHIRVGRGRGTIRILEADLQAFIQQRRIGQHPLLQPHSSGA